MHEIYQSIAHPDWNPWDNDKNTLELYRRRCLQQAEEMTCAAQSAEILKKFIHQKETLLDAGCGGGYYYWSFHNRNIPIDYYGIDYTPKMIALANKEMLSVARIKKNRFILDDIGHLQNEYDTILCFNVLTNNPHYALPLERLLVHSRKKILIRESMGERLDVRFTPDPYLNEGKRHIRVYHNTYPLKEVMSFMRKYGFKVTGIKDKRTNDGKEMVVDIPHYWKILLGERILKKYY